MMNQHHVICGDGGGKRQDTGVPFSRQLLMAMMRRRRRLCWRSERLDVVRVRVAKSKVEELAILLQFVLFSCERTVVFPPRFCFATPLLLRRFVFLLTTRLTTFFAFSTTLFRVLSPPRAQAAKTKPV